MTATSIQELAENHPFAITAKVKEKTAYIRITGTIWRWNNNAEWFRQKIEEYNAQGVTKLHIYINSPGGSVFEANEICNEIKTFKGKVTGEGGAMVASAATVIALECDTFEMPSNGQWMYHKPMMIVQGNEDRIESELVGLKNLTKQYKKGYAAKTTLTEAKIEKKWAKGDVWLSAEKALKEGWITGIKKEPVKISTKAVALFAACGCPTEYKAEKEKNQKPKSKNMNELEALALKLGLPQNSTQEVVDAKLEEIQASAAKAEGLEKYAKDKEDADQEKAVKALLDGAVKDKKLNAKQAEGMKGWAESDFAGCEAHIKGLDPAGKPKVRGAADGEAAATLADKKFEALTDAEKDQLAEEDPEAFSAKYEEYLNTEDK